LPPPVAPPTTLLIRGVRNEQGTPVKKSNPRARSGVRKSSASIMLVFSRSMQVHACWLIVSPVIPARGAGNFLTSTFLLTVSLPLWFKKSETTETVRQ
jgi:hypothetical protein